MLTRKRTESAAAERAECVGRPHSSSDDVGQEWGRRREERRLQLSRSGLQAMGRIEGVHAAALTTGCVQWWCACHIVVCSDRLCCTVRVRVRACVCERMWNVAPVTAHRPQVETSSASARPGRPHNAATRREGTRL
jgi:hypothetical protein